MNSMRIFILAGSLLIAGMAHAGSGGIRDGGNGGDAVVCRDSNGQIKKIEMLDALEARLLYGLSPKLGDASLSVNEKLELVFKQIERLNPARAKRYREAVANWAFQNISFTDEKLEDIPDSNHNLIPDGCNVEQIAIRQEINRNYPGDPWYSFLTVQRTLWSALDRDNQAILVLHELFYWDTSHVKGVYNSRPARYLNAMAFSGQLGSMDSATYFKLAKDNQLSDVDYSGLLIDPRASEFYPDGRIKIAKAGSFSKILGTLLIQGQSLQVTEHADFDERGRLKATVLPESALLETLLGKFKVRGKLEFNEQGIVSSFDHLEGSSVTLSLSGTQFTCSAREEVLARKDGVMCRMEKGTQITGPRSTLSVVRDGWVTISTSGQLQWQGNFWEAAVLAGQMVTAFGKIDLEGMVSSSTDYAIFNGRLHGPQTVQILGKGVAIDGGIKFFDSLDRLTYFEPKADVVLNDIPIAGQFGCGLFGSKKVPTFVRMTSTGFVYQFVLSDWKTWTWTYQEGNTVKRGSFTAGPGDLVTLDMWVGDGIVYGGSKKSWCDVYENYFGGNK